MDASARRLYRRQSLALIVGILHTHRAPRPDTFQKPCVIRIDACEVACRLIRNGCAQCRPGLLGIGLDSQQCRAPRGIGGSCRNLP